MNERNENAVRTILFETERLTVGSFIPEDANDLADILTDPEVTFFEPYLTFTREKCVQEAVHLSKSNEFYAVLQNGTVIGKIYFSKQQADTYTLGYTFGAAYQGKGFAAESIGGFLEYAFSEWNVRRVIAEIDVRNSNSVKLAERIGMRREAEHKALYPDKHIPARYHDFYIYAILKQEYIRKDKKIIKTKNPSLTPEEMRAVKFYEGDITENDRDDSFWGDARAYITLNALLYDNLATEYVRSHEGKRLNPAISANSPRLVRLYAALLSAAEKGVQTADTICYRVERADDFEVCLERGMTNAFTSTSRSGFLPAYGDKQKIVLLCYHAPAGTPLIIFSNLLNQYLKSNEDEILLPPFLRFDAEKRPLTDADCCIFDQNDAPPIAAYDLYILPKQHISLCTEHAAALPDIYPTVAKLYAQIQQNIPEDHLNPDDRAAYLQYKRALRCCFKHSDPPTTIL